MLEQFPIYEYFGKLAAWLPNALLRWRYSEQRLADLIYIDLQPRGDSAAVDLAGVATANVTIQLINLSPFAVELDRAAFVFNVAGVPVNMAILNRLQLPSGVVTSAYLRAQVSDGQADHIANIGAETRAWLDGTIDFNCAVRPFQKRLASLQDIHPRLVNLQLRKPA